MEGPWQSKCGSTWPLSTPPSSSSSQNQILNAGYHSYSHTVLEPCSASREIMQQPTFPCTSNLSYYNSGHAELGSSFLSLLSGPSSVLQNDLQLLSNQNQFFSSDVVPVNINNVVFQAAGSGVSCAANGLSSQTSDSKHVKTGVDLLQNVLPRAVTGENCISAACLHDILEAASLNRQNAEVGKSVSHHSLSGNNMMELSFLRGGWPASPSLSHARKMHFSNIQSSPSSSVPLQSFALKSSFPRVFCLGASGELLLSNTGLLGVRCSCHGLYMSISKFCEHSGVRGVNPGEAVCLDSGETIAQWRKLYFHKFGIRVSEDHNGWNWPEGFSAAASAVNCTSTLSNITRSSELNNAVGNSGAALIETVHPLNVSFLNDSIKSPKVDIRVVNNGIKERNTQDSWNFLKGITGTSGNNFHAIAENRPLCSTMSKLVGKRISDNGSQSISTTVDSISKTENSLISFQNLQDFKPPEKVSHIVSFSSLKEGGIVDRAPVPSNIELRLGQPSQQNQVQGNLTLPAPKSHISDNKHVHLQKSILPGQPINSSNGARNFRAMEEYIQNLQFSSDTTSTRRREQRHLGFANYARDIYNVVNVSKKQELTGDASRSTFSPPLLLDVNNYSEGKMQYKATNIAVSRCISTGEVLGGSYIANSDTVCLSLNRCNNTQNWFNNEFGISKDLKKGKAVACTVNCEHGSDLRFNSKYKGILSNSDGLIGEIGHCTSSSSLDKNSHPFQLPSVPTNVDARNPPTHYSPTLSHNGKFDHHSYRSLSLPMDSGLSFPSQAFGLGLSQTTSLSIPNDTTVLSTKDWLGIRPQLLSENLDMLALGHTQKISNQHHVTTSLLPNQDERRYDYCPSDKILGYLADPSSSTGFKCGPDLVHKHDSLAVSRISLHSGSAGCVDGDSETLSPVAVISQGTKLRSDVETRCQILCNSCLDGQSPLRSETTNSRVSGTGNFCQKRPHEYIRGKCCCAVHTNSPSKDCDFKIGTSCTSFSEQVMNSNREASMSFGSNFDGDSNFTMERIISESQSDFEPKKVESKRVVCHSFQWKDVPNKMMQICNVTHKDQLANSSDENINEQVATAKCFDRSAQDAESMKDQELSNISSGYYEPAITQAINAVGTKKFCSGNVLDMISTDDVAVDESSGIDILSPDYAIDGGRSSYISGISREINCSDKRSLKASQNQSSRGIIDDKRSLKASQNQSSRGIIDELRLSGSLSLKKTQNPIHTGLVYHEKPNYLQNCKGNSKIEERKNARKWKMVDEFFHPSGSSPAHYERHKFVSSSEQLNGFSDLHRPDQAKFPSCNCSSGTTCGCIRPPLPLSKSSSRKRDWHKICGGRELVGGFETLLRSKEDSLQTYEVSHGKMLISDRHGSISKEGGVQEPKFTVADMSVKCNSADCMITSSGIQLNVCTRKARPVVCEKYGVILNFDASKPAKFLSLRNILKTARRTTLHDTCLNLSSENEFKKRKFKVSNGSDDEFKEVGLQADGDVAACSKLGAHSFERTKDSVFLPIGSNHDDTPYLLDEESLDIPQQICSNNKNHPISESMKRKVVRKRSLYELSSTGKDTMCEERSVAKQLKSASPTECEYMGNPENCEGHGKDLCSYNKVSGELRGQSKLILDAFCCVCGSSNEEEVNCLLECNQCLIVVHQACYGVARVPKANWFCRPCRVGSKNNICVLCGYGDGAMTLALQSHNIVKGLLDSWNVISDSPSQKQNLSTDVWEGKLNVSTSSSFVIEGNPLPVSRPAHNKSATTAKCKMGMQEQLNPVDSSVCASSNSLLYNSITAGVLDSTVKQWVHMVCGLWTPGTRCLNVNTMSAFDVSGACPKINAVCSFCFRSGGSCIQCRVLGCSMQFHPWCAHQKGLLQSEVEGFENENVGFYGRCELHAAGDQCNSDIDPADAISDLLARKESKCARTEGYIGRNRDGFRHTIPNRSGGVGGCVVSHEQLNAWIHITKQKPHKGYQKLAAPDIEYDCRKEYKRYKQSKGWTSLVVYKSGIHGLGLYTSQFISLGAMVVEYVGEIVGLRVADKREREYHAGNKLQYKSACYFFRISKENIIDATCKGGIARYVNHSCMPNCVAKIMSVRHEKKVVFFADRDIYPGEEITYDYHFNHEDEGKKIPCFCNSKNCSRYLN